MALDTHPASSLTAFFSRFPQKHFAKGELILYPSDEHLPKITYIEEGIVAQYAIHASGTKVIVNIFKAGAFFPAASAVNHTLNTYFFEASTEVTGRQAEPQAVEELLHHNPAITYDLLQRVYRGTDGLLGRLSLLLDGSARSKLLYELVISSERFGEIIPEGRLLRITEDELAQQIGLARETVSRTLKTLRTEGLVSLQRGAILLYSHALQA